MADNSRSRGFAAKEQKLQDKLDNLQSRYGKAKETYRGRRRREHLSYEGS
jgi:hypothetical protein